MGATWAPNVIVTPLEGRFPCKALCGSHGPLCGPRVAIVLASLGPSSRAVSNAR
jgi:hypothetical protein